MHPSIRALAPLALLLAGACGGASPAEVAAAEPSLEPPDSAAPPAPAGPRIAFPRPGHDFGHLDDTRTVSCEFPFTNEGPGTLEITELKTSCGCTTTQLGKTTFEPGEGDVIRVEWLPTGLGNQVQYVDVMTPAGRARRLSLRAHVTPKVEVRPLAADFGDVPQATGRSMQLELWSRDADVAVREAVSELPQAVLATFLPAGPDAPAGLLGKLDVFLKPRNLRGALGTKVHVTNVVRASDGEEDRTYTMDVPVRATIYGAVQVDPQAFYISKVLPGGSIDYSVRMRRPDGAVFGLELARLVHCPLEEVALEVVEGQDDEGFFIDLRVAGPVGDYLGKLKGAVTVKTDIPDDQQMFLNLYGIVRE